MSSSRPRATCQSEIYDCRQPSFVASSQHSECRPTVIASTRQSSCCSGCQVPSTRSSARPTRHNRLTDDRSSFVSSSSVLSDISDFSRVSVAPQQPIVQEFTIPGRRREPRPTQTHQPQEPRAPHDSSRFIQEALLLERLAAHEESLDELFTRASRGPLQRYVPK